MEKLKNNKIFLIFGLSNWQKCSKIILKLSMHTEIIPPVRLQSIRLLVCNLLQYKQLSGLATHSLNEQKMDALADIGVRQHGFCEWMSGLDNLKIIQPHRWKLFVHFSYYVLPSLKSGCHTGK